jgi:hypothetical protein
MADKSAHVPRAAGATLGSTGEDVARVQRYLALYGYFDSGVHARYGMTAQGAVQPPAEFGEFEDRTRQALEAFQRFFGLELTGEVDDATVEAMHLPRCDRPDVGSAALGSYVLQGNKWDHTDLQYGFFNTTGDLSQAQVESAVAQAFGLWSAVTPLTFQQVAVGTNPEIRILFQAGAHGDGNPFDGASGVLAHAYYPIPASGDLAGDAHFDEAETWSVSDPATGIDLVTVAAHEFGHSLGLAHSDVGGALMFPSYSGINRALSDDDVAGIQALYGAQEWVTAKVVRAYATTHARNAWGYLDGHGWRKVSPDAPDGVTNVFAALVAARTSNKAVTALVTGNQIERIYL